MPTGDEGEPEEIDNCQHVLLRCCVNLLDFYTRLGVRDRIKFYREFFFLEPGGRLSVLRRGRLPAPFHFTGAFLRMHCLSRADKTAIARALYAMRRERTRRKDLDKISMLDWLLQKRQTPHAIDRFWRQVLVSAVNEDLDRMAAIHGFQVFWTGFLASADAYEMGVPVDSARQTVRRGGLEADRQRAHPFPLAGGAHRRERLSSSPAERRTGDHYICALPFERLEAVGLDAPKFEHSPITGVHLWFDREITTLPHATLLDRTMQWMFNKDSGKYLQCVVSASRDLTNLSRNEIIDIAIGDLRLYFPKVKEARLVKAHVIKEQRATFSAAPETGALRPTPESGAAQSDSGGRLDADRLARDHGRRRPQRLSRGGSRVAGRRQTPALPHRVARDAIQWRSCRNLPAATCSVRQQPPASAAVSCAPRPAKLRIGVTDWNLKLGAKPEAVPLAAQLGFDGVQVSFGRRLVDDKLPLDNPELIDRYLFLSGKLKIPLDGTCVDKLHDNGLKSDKLAVRWVLDSIRLTKALHTDVLLLPFFGKWADPERRRARLRR